MLYWVDREKYIEFIIILLLNRHFIKSHILMGHKNKYRERLKGRSQVARVLQAS